MKCDEILCDYWGSELILLFYILIKNSFKFYHLYEFILYLKIFETRICLEFLWSQQYVLVD